MNLRGRVIDAWREVAVTANALKAGLNVSVSATPMTQSGADSPLDFRASASTYTAGVQFDGPLNRQAQRNAYRASQIAYQHSRRRFMARADQISSAIRSDERGLELERANFGIARQALISAARQLQSAPDRLPLNP